MNIGTLILEVTRRCNMRCEHCLRGDAQKLDMSQEVISATLTDVSTIGTLIFTGGEPSLACGVIARVIDSLGSTEVQNFWVATNGKSSKKVAGLFAVQMLELYDLCTENEISAMVVSGDMYHEDVKIPRIYEGLKFFQEERHGPKCDEHVIREGRGLLLGSFKPKEQSPWEVDGDWVQEDIVYVAANGNVTSCCDMSFDRIDRECKGNVLETPLWDIISSYTTEKA